MKKILILKYGPLRQFVQAVSSFAAIRASFPDAEISIITEEKTAEFCQVTGYFDRIIVDNMPQWYDYSGLKSIISKIRNGGKKSNFDMIYDLQGSQRTDWYFKLLGYNKPRWNSSTISWCSNPYEKPGGWQNIHIEDLLHDQLRAGGVSNFKTINFSDFAQKIESSNMPEKYAMICAAGDRQKMANKWDLEKYSEVISYLENERGIRSVLIGKGDDDASINQYICDITRNAKPINLINKTTIQDLIFVAKNSMFCLGNDTATAHIAAFTGVKTILLCNYLSKPDVEAPRVPNLGVLSESVIDNISATKVIEAIEDNIISSYGKDVKFKVLK